MTIAKLIRKLIDAAGINQAELARRIDSTPQHVCNVVKGRAGLNADTLLKIIAATGHEIARKNNAD